MKTKIIAIAITALIGLPVAVSGSSIISSLIDGKTPGEAVIILAGQIDGLLGRVAVLEEEQDQTAQVIEGLKSEQDQTNQELNQTRLEIQRLKLENENLKLRNENEDQEKALKEQTLAQCKEAAREFQRQTDIVSATLSEETKIKVEPLQQKLSSLKAEYAEVKASEFTEKLTFDENLPVEKRTKLRNDFNVRRKEFNAERARNIAKLGAEI